MSGIDHPWEESRGMGVSYGYNRAENLNVYHTGRELVMILVDTVSRGGNLLLDIGPGADGTIPVIMEERLTQIGDWLKINGDAIYGTKPWKATQQWSAGEVPKIEYNKEYSSAYDVNKLTDKPEPGKAGIEAFFTTKGSDMYAILPQWSKVLWTIPEFGRTGEIGNTIRLTARSSIPTLAGNAVPLEDQEARPILPSWKP